MQNYQNHQVAFNRAKFQYNQFMGLYWKELEIVCGMLLELDLYHHEVINSEGKFANIMWKVISFGSRKNDEAYLEYSNGKKYPIKKVIKNKRLQGKLNRKELLHIPACSDFMVVQEYHDGKEVLKRCYNLDMMGAIRNIRIIE